VLTRMRDSADISDAMFSSWFLAEKNGN